MQGDIGAPHCWNHKQLLFHWHSPVKIQPAGWNSQAIKKKKTRPKNQTIKQSKCDLKLASNTSQHLKIPPLSPVQSLFTDSCCIASIQRKQNRPKNFEKNRKTWTDRKSKLSYPHWHHQLLPASHSLTWHFTTFKNVLWPKHSQCVQLSNRFLCSHDSWGSGLCHTAGTCRLTPSMPIFDTASTSWTQCCLNELQQPPWMQQHKYVHLYSPWYIYIHIVSNTKYSLALSV